MKKHPSISDHAVDILLDFCNDMKNEPRKLNMSSWLDDVSNQTEMKLKDKPPCNTIMCIAGGIALKTTTALDLMGISWYQIPFIAAEAIGLSYDRDSRYNPGNVWNLFIPEYWPHKYKMQYDKAKSQKQRVIVMTRRVKYFIEKGY